jgi:hypothetical protein
MSKNTKETPKSIPFSEHELRTMLIMGGPEPISVRKVKAMTARLLSLQQEIIEVADPKMRRTLLSWITSSLDDLIESANRQRSASDKLDAVLEVFERKRATIGQ